MGDRRYIISETSARTGLESHVLRYWEEELGLKIPRNELGHRYYTDEHIKLFCKIKELKEKGYQLKAIKSELAGKSELKLDLSDIRADIEPPISPDSAKNRPQASAAPQGTAEDKGTAPARETADASETEGQEILPPIGSVKRRAEAAGAGKTEISGTEAVQTVSPAAANEVSAPAVSRPMAPDRGASQSDRLEQFRAIIGGIVTEALQENNVVLQDELTYSVSEKVIKEMDYLLRLKEESEDERFKKLDETIRNCQRSSREAAAYSEGRGWKRKRKNRRV